MDSTPATVPQINQLRPGRDKRFITRVLTLKGKAGRARRSRNSDSPASRDKANPPPPLEQFDRSSSKT
jgi:hypothetical protein